MTAGLVVYRTPVAELLPLFDLLQSEGHFSAVGIFDNGNDAMLRDEVMRRGWHYLQAGQNVGFGAGHNRIFAAIGEAGHYHLIVNPDVSWHTSPVPVLLALLQQHDKLAAVMPDVFASNGQRQYLAKRMPSPQVLFGRRFGVFARGSQRVMAAYELREFSFACPAVVPIISGCCMLCRGTALQQVDGFDEGYFLYLEDYDLCRRWRIKGWRVAIDPAARIVHGHARSSYRWGKPLYWHICSAFRYFSRWGWWQDATRSAGVEPLPGKD
ncbi:glycosyltransferase [Andreprevotia sp. IGB-42]|uniref:glycosyltransferase n=1 Tax=Andreprevotia sp. IGB-42 TaxID=2497473 RepID=UPI00135976EC|nr:glycosyltransferase family 2 protein [Andreprevotia sp. IGB-42]